MNEIVRVPVASLVALLVAAAPVACSKPVDTAPPPLAGAKIGGAFRLTDQDGRSVTDTSFAGKYRVMYFGYTFCPDVCPTDMQTLGQGLRAFEAKDAARGAKVVPVFVTVDPERDTPAVLRPFVAAFHARMVGLTGSPAAIAAIAKEYAVFYEKQPPAPGGGYMVQHSRVAYLMDPNDKPLALIPVDKTPGDVAAELGRWVR
ncbi:SCO family protein [Sphingomonas sp. H39-1-10]|uniref:SCO family protein n=1 Tax=Sphingomonas TaxID=13687 RepID=UPI000883A3B2|nr:MULTISPECIES: SCO family protein [Sphingomonas]MDF0488041.1 SCO family protein [Sphingomonas pollutisoli]SDA33102.1 protein SCO1/2 [Sphingomonas sp. NFR15]